MDEPEPPAASASPATFEQSLERLEGIVRRLEDGRLGLSDALKCYEEGVRYLRSCYEALNSAEQKIELLTGIDAEGNPVTEPYMEAEMSLEEKKSSRSRRRSVDQRPPRAETSSNDMDDGGPRL
jgi:exodeoxyribonuclease VII small subunit